MKVYIAGPITGNDRNKEQFAAVEKAMQEIGLEPVSPVGAPGFWEYKQYIDHGLRKLMDCEAICVINASIHRNRDIKDIPSKGTQLELLYAQTVGMPVLEAHPDTRGRYSITIEKCWPGMFKPSEI